MAEPSPAVKQQLKGLRTTGKILMYTGYGLSGFGLASTIVGAVLIAIHQGPKMQTIGIATLITGVATLAGGAALWGVGRWRMDQADLLLIRAQMRQVQLQDPAPPRSGSRALVLPTTHTIFSAQLRF